MPKAFPRKVPGVRFPRSMSEDGRSRVLLEAISGGGA